MIREFRQEDKEALCRFFARLIDGHKEYISHGELQMGIATEVGVLANDFREKWADYLDRQVANERNRVLLCEEDGQLVGFVIFGISDDGGIPFGWIFDLGVDPAWRGKSIGEQLLGKALEFFREQGVESCYLESGKNNHSAHSFFEHHGFCPVSAVFRLKL